MRESFPEEIYNRAMARLGPKRVGEFDAAAHYAMFYIGALRAYLAGMDTASFDAEEAEDTLDDEIGMYRRLILPKEQVVTALALAKKYGIGLKVREMTVDEAIERLQNARSRYAIEAKDAYGVPYTAGYKRDFTRTTAQILASRYVVVEIDPPEGSDGVILLGVATDTGFSDPKTNKPILRFADFATPAYWTAERRDHADLLHCDRCNRRVYRKNVYIGRSAYASGITNTRVGQYGGECASVLGLDTAFRRLLKGLTKIDELLSEDPDAGGGFGVAGRFERRPVPPEILVAYLDILLRSNPWVSSARASEKETESTAEAIGYRASAAMWGWFVADYPVPYAPRDKEEKAAAKFWTEAIDAYFEDEARTKPKPYLRELIEAAQAQIEESEKRVTEKGLRDWVYRARIALLVGVPDSRFSRALASIVHMARSNLARKVGGLDNLPNLRWAPVNPNKPGRTGYDVAYTDVPPAEWPRLADEDQFADIEDMLGFYGISRADYDTATRTGKPIAKSKLGALPTAKPDKGMTLVRGVWLVLSADVYEGDYGTTYKAFVVRNDGTRLRLSGSDLKAVERGDRIRVRGGSQKFLPEGYGRDGKLYPASWSLTGVAVRKTDAAFVTSTEVAVEAPAIPAYEGDTYWDPSRITLGKKRRY
jgi:hypothetical protein